MSYRVQRRPESFYPLGIADLSAPKAKVWIQAGAVEGRINGISARAARHRCICDRGHDGSRKGGMYDQSAAVDQGTSYLTIVIRVWGAGRVVAGANYLENGIDKQSVGNGCPINR